MYAVPQCEPGLDPTYSLIRRLMSDYEVTLVNDNSESNSAKSLVAKC